MIKKLKNKKGFAMAELLAVSMVVLILFSILFSNYLPLVAEYENRLSYNDVTAQYAAHYISKIYDEAMYSSDVQPNNLQKLVENKTKEGKYYVVYGENEETNEIYNGIYFGNNNSKILYNKKVIEEYKIKEIVITTFKLDKLKGKLGNESGYPKDGALYNYIKYLPKYENAILDGDKETYRVIVKTDYGYATTSIKTSTCKGNTIGEYKKEEGTNIANEPVLDGNMIPVYYDTCVGEWKKADVNNEADGYRWYNYDEKVWANSVTVSSTNRSTYLNAAPGTEIDMDDILTMQVWIPRYKYYVWNSIKNYNNGGIEASEPDKITIEFESDTESTGHVTCDSSIQGKEETDENETTKLSETCSIEKNGESIYTHPAFTFGNDQLKGFWVGKFEISTFTNENCYKSEDEESKKSNCNKIGITPLIKPNVKSYRNASVSVFDNNIRNMISNNNIYGFSNATDTHMIKNSEWGAVAYLSHSEYGTCTDETCREVYINNSESHYTGRSGGDAAGSTPIKETYTDQASITQYNSYGFYRYDGYLLEYNTNRKTTTRDLSKVASTTGNIYGVYDMSGGSREYTMANIVSSDGTTMMSGYNSSNNSGYTGIVEKTKEYTGRNYPEDKYYDKYSYSNFRVSLKASKLGDGIKEVLCNSNKAIGWYGDQTHFVTIDNPWFFRGGNSKVNEGSSNAESIDTIGIFASSYYTGEPNDTYSTRAIIVPQEKENQ